MKFPTLFEVEEYLMEKGAKPTGDTHPPGKYSDYKNSFFEEQRKAAGKLPWDNKYIIGEGDHRTELTVMYPKDWDNEATSIRLIPLERTVHYTFFDLDVDESLRTTSELGEKLKSFKQDIDKVKSLLDKYKFEYESNGYDHPIEVHPDKLPSDHPDRILSGSNASSLINCHLSFHGEPENVKVGGTSRYLIRLEFEVTLNKVYDLFKFYDDCSELNIDRKQEFNINVEPHYLP